MEKIATAERVSGEASDNFVFQRSLLAYHFAASHIEGHVLEIGTGSGYGVRVIAPNAEHFTTLDKHRPSDSVITGENIEFIEASVPPLPFPDEKFDCVISFQVIEHIKDDKRFVKEVHRVLRPGGVFIVSTPNIKMSLTRNPWHIREYTKEQFAELLSLTFSSVEQHGVEGGEKVMEYYEQNRKGVERFTRWDILDLQHRLPRQLLQIPYDILNRMNRRKLLDKNQELTRSIAMEDYKIAPVSDQSFDLIYIAHK